MDAEFHPLPQLAPQEVEELAYLLRRAIANSQLAFHEQDLDAAGVETEQGVAIVAEDWAVDPDLITFDDGTTARFGVHLYVSSADLDRLCGSET